ncbi:LCP family protein [Polymorphospora rubra]|uniref:LCP family protein n=1 Tax=Polymorphospora rubra TaxID=338584 RepID=UPI0033C50C45
MPRLSQNEEQAQAPVLDATEVSGRAKKRGLRRAQRIGLIVLLVFAVVGGGGALAAGFYLRSIESGIDRVDAFNDVPEESRPAKVAERAMNLLLLGSDSRDPDNTTGSRTDTIILAHLAGDRSSAQLISIPRDTWVHVPAQSGGGGGNRDAKINASFAWGGVPLMVQTVEGFTGVRIDHVVMIDFAGFTGIVDAVGGVDIDVDGNFTSIHPPFRSFREGVQRMDGATALDYARQRQQFADGDFARIRHQQQVIKAILDGAASGGMFANPAKMNSFVRAATDTVSIDETLSLFDMANDLRHLRSSNLTFLTSPTAGTGTKGTESVVLPDTDQAKVLYEAVKTDKVPEILAAAKTKP